MLILCCQGDTPCRAKLPHTHKHTPWHARLHSLIQIHSSTNKHQETITVCLEFGLYLRWRPWKSTFSPSYQTFVLHTGTSPDQLCSLLKAVWLVGHWCWTLSPDTFNLKQSTLGWLSRPSADRRQNKTHCFLFQDCYISQAGLCACVHQALHHCLAAS